MEEKKSSHRIAALTRAVNAVSSHHTSFKKETEAFERKYKDLLDQLKVRQLLGDFHVLLVRHQTVDSNESLAMLDPIATIYCCGFSSLEGQLLQGPGVDQVCLTHPHFRICPLFSGA